jgi:hypothetical protein
MMMPPYVSRLHGMGDELSDDHPVRPRTNTDLRALALLGNRQDAAPCSQNECALQAGSRGSVPAPGEANPRDDLRTIRGFGSCQQTAKADSRAGQGR